MTLLDADGAEVWGYARPHRTRPAPPAAPGRAAGDRGARVGAAARPDAPAPVPHLGGRWHGAGALERPVAGAVRRGRLLSVGQAAPGDGAHLPGARRGRDAPGPGRGRHGDAGAGRPGGGAGRGGR
ncbi:hypothetical protein NKH77_19175 [Streptomyces sp. M19]